MKSRQNRTQKKLNVAGNQHKNKNKKCSTRRRASIGGNGWFTQFKQLFRKSTSKKREKLQYLEKVLSIIKTIKMRKWPRNIPDINELNKYLTYHCRRRTYGMNTTCKIGINKSRGNAFSSTYVPIEVWSDKRLNTLEEYLKNTIYDLQEEIENEMMDESDKKLLNALSEMNRLVHIDKKTKADNANIAKQKAIFEKMVTSKGYARCFNLQRTNKNWKSIVEKAPHLLLDCSDLDPRKNIRIQTPETESETDSESGSEEDNYDSPEQIFAARRQPHNVETLGESESPFLGFSPTTKRRLF